jgi:PAS domain S-box-containing protein
LDFVVEVEVARERAEKAHMQFRALLEAAPDSMIVTDSGGRIVLANGRTRRIFGYAAAELAGSAMAMLLPAWKGKDPEAGETWARRKDGSGFPADVTLSPMASDQGTLIIAAVRDITLRKQAEEGTRKSLLEKEALLKEIHHRVKNNLQIVSSLLRLQASRIRDEKDREMMRESEERVNSMSLIHEMLYQAKDLSRIQFGDYVAGLTSELLQGYAADPGRIRLDLDVEPVDLDINWAIPLGLIINELVSNALKYAFPGGRAGTIGLLLAVRNGELILEVRDDGVGLPLDLEARRTGSLGLQIVDSLSRQLGGEGRFTSEGEGARFRLTVRL